VLVDPILKEIGDVFPEVTPIDRPSSNAWSHPDVRAAVEATGRKKLIIAGLTTEVCLAQSSLSAIKDGFDVYFVTDCSGGVSTEAHESAKVRLTMAGAKPITWAAVTAEWAPYWASPEAAIVSGAYTGGAALLTDYVTAQLTAGVVSPPDFLSVPAQAGATSGQP
jgi:hypothetical protein